MKNVTLNFRLAVLVTAIFSIPSAFACTASQWNGGTTGAPLAGDPPTALPRVSGQCAMQLDAEGSVQDNSPAAEPQAFIRFYVLADLNSGNPVIFQGFSDDAATTPLFSVAFNGTTFSFEAGDNNDVATGIPGKTGWNMVELAWVGGASMDFWVNVDSSETPTGNVNAAAGTLESVILGVPAAPAIDGTGLDGTLVFDDYVSHRTTKIGPIAAPVICDAEGDGDIDVNDALAIFNERFLGQVNDGAPDCDLSGAVNVNDALEVFNIRFGGG